MSFTLKGQLTDGNSQQVSNYIITTTNYAVMNFHPLLKPNISPGTNPMPAAKGNPQAAIVEECVEICDAALLTMCISWFVTFSAELYLSNIALIR
jgi:hypothetical protein